MLCFAWLRVERQVQARWSCRKWFIGTEPWPAAMAPWAAILSDLLNRAGLGLFVPSVEDLRGEPGCCKTLLSIVPWVMLFSPGEERAGSAEQGVQVGAVGWPHFRGVQHWGWKAEGTNKLSSVLSVNSEPGRNWLLTSKGIWGAEYCGILWESQSQSLSLKHTADLAEISVRYQLVSYFSQL